MLERGELSDGGFDEPRDRFGDARRGRPAPGVRLERGARPQAMDTYRIEVGRAHQVKPANIVGVVSNETGLQGPQIGRIEIFEEHSTIDLLAGMPAEMLAAMKKVRVLGRPLNMQRLGEAAYREDRRPFFKKFQKSKVRRPAARS